MGPTRSRKVRIRWLDGEFDGLDEWVPLVRLRARWQEAEHLLADERRKLRLHEASSERFDLVEWEAVIKVWFSGVMPECVSPNGWELKVYGLLTIERFTGTSVELALPRESLLSHSDAFVDRTGTYFGPPNVGVDLARRYCEVFPDQVLQYVRAERMQMERAVATGWIDSIDDEQPRRVDHGRVLEQMRREDRCGS